MGERWLRIHRGAEIESGFTALKIEDPGVSNLTVGVGGTLTGKEHSFLL